MIKELLPQIPFWIPCTIMGIVVVYSMMTAGELPKEEVVKKKVKKTDKSKNKPTKNKNSSKKKSSNKPNKTRKTTSIAI